MPKFRIAAIFQPSVNENANQMVTDVTTPPKAHDVPVTEETKCPSFEAEPWKSRVQTLKEQTKDQFFLIDWNKTTITPPPLSLNHGYVKLYLEFLDTVPKECWIDEENEQD